MEKMIGFARLHALLAWLLDSIGTPTWALGLLVPVRESLAILPQLAISLAFGGSPYASSSTCSDVSSRALQSSASA